MSLRVLIVDDSARFVLAARTLLEHDVDVVGVASTSADALKQVDELDPDVALVDVALGRESGLELARRLAVTGRPVPVILISTRAEDDLADLIADCPVLGFVPKSELSAGAIQRLLDSRRHGSFR